MRILKIYFEVHKGEDYFYAIKQKSRRKIKMTPEVYSPRKQRGLDLPYGIEVVFYPIY